jgi:penicillin-binding protein 1A
VRYIFKKTFIPLAIFSISLASLWNGAYFYVESSLPDAEVIRDIRLELPMSIYTRDGRLFAQFGERQLTPVTFNDIPERLIKALLASEDDRFYSHPGYDYQGILRAGINFIISGGSRSQGGSTITQQLAREYFLSRDRTFVRKFKELILAMRMEEEFTKNEILELYFNKTFFGQRSYGVVAASQIYFGKSLNELTISDIAILAGAPRAPSILNPINNPAATAQRRSYVLGRMLALDIISDQEYQIANETPIISRRFGPQVAIAAPYVAEMVRSEVIDRFGLSAYSKGLKVTTSIDSRLQRAASESIKYGLHLYDEGHGYRGAIGSLDYLDLPAYLADVRNGNEDSLEILNDALSSFPIAGDLTNAIVLNLPSMQINNQPPRATLFIQEAGIIELDFDQAVWARMYINDDFVAAVPEDFYEIMSIGDVIRLRRLSNGAYRLAQLPLSQASLVSLDPFDGGIVALVGGYDFALSNFNRAVQARRQPGSAFKPFVYSGALENGYSVASIINDAPIVESGTDLGDDWRPQNYSGQFYGPVRLRESLVRSLNLASIRLLRDAGINDIVPYVKRFGFDNIAVPNNLTLALGSGGVSPLDVTKGYAVFANGGFSVNPYLIENIEDMDGNIIYQHHPDYICPSCLDNLEEGSVEDISDHLEFPFLRSANRIITPQNAYLMYDVMRDVIQKGTGIRAYNELRRNDIAGKTGTTNDRRDAWFSGFNNNIVVSTWVGFDQERSLGRLEQGARTALPMWINFMKEALYMTPEAELNRPSGLVDVRIDPSTGLMTTDLANGIFEIFRANEIPDVLERDQNNITGRPLPEENNVTNIF